MRLLGQRGTSKAAIKAVGKRICAMALVLELLLELCGAGPAFLFSQLLTQARAEDSFVYQPNTMDIAVLPRDDVFSLTKVQKLESANAGVSLDVNDKFGNKPVNASGVIYAGNDTKIGSGKSGGGNWSATYEWDVTGTQKVKNHLTNQAADLEAFWSGTYTRSDNGDPSVLLWYYGNTSWKTGYDGAKNAFVWKVGGAFSSGVSGKAKNGKTAGLGVGYKAYFPYSTWEAEYDENGNPRFTEEKLVTVTDPKTGEQRQEYRTVPKLFERPHKEVHTVVVGERRLIRDYWLRNGEFDLNHYNKLEYAYPNYSVTLSGAGGTSVTNTKMRLRDTAAPFLNSIKLKKNSEYVTGDVHVRNNDTLYIELTFNEDIRFADNAASDHDLKLKLSFVDSSNGTSDSDSWIEAELVKLKGKTMTFRFDRNSRCGKTTLPDEFYIDGISAAAQSGWYSSSEDFPLSLIDASNRTIPTGSSCCGVVTDLAGNPFEKFNLTRFEDKARAYFDNLAPAVYRTSMWTTNLSEEEAAIGNNINETDPDKLFLKTGDKVWLRVVFSEEMDVCDEDLDGNLLNATLNVTDGGNPVILTPSWVRTIDSKSIDVNAPRRSLTMVRYEPMTVSADMTVEGSYIQITDINGLNVLGDLAGNKIVDKTIPQPPCQQKIDVTAPTITFGDVTPDGADPDVFTLPILFDDNNGSGFAGNKFRFRMIKEEEYSSGLQWMVDGSPSITSRESDNKTVDTTGWADFYTMNSERIAHYLDQVGWADVTPPVNASQLYLHIKIKKPESWNYALTDEAGEAANTFQTGYGGSIRVEISDIKKNKTTEETSFTHTFGHTESVITFGGVSYSSGTATIPVTVTNPVGFQRITWGTSESNQSEVVHTGELSKSKSFNVSFDTGVSGTINLYVAAYGPSGKPDVNSVEYTYDFSAGALTYETTLGDEKEPLFGLPSVTDMEVSEGNRAMVLIDKSDGSYFATTDLPAAGKNLFAEDSGVTWYSLTGTAAADYSSLTVSQSSASSAEAVAAWLDGVYGKVTFVLLNQNSQNPNGDGGWTDDAPGSYVAEGHGIVYAVERAYLANGADFDVTTDVTYSEGRHAAVPAEVLSGDPSEPHSDLSDYTFTATLTNTTDDPNAEPRYGLRIVESAEAELFYSSNGTDYESVRVVELPVGSLTKLTFTKADGERTGWYKVVYRYTVNGKTTETTIASDVYLDDTSAITPDVVSYSRSFDLYVREPKWRYSTYFTDYSWLTHTSSAADDDIEDGEIVNIGVAPIAVPQDKLPEGSERYSYSLTSTSINDDDAYADRYYLTENEENVLTFNFSQTDPQAGSASISRIGGVNHFYAWSGNDPDGREDARANWQTFSVNDTVTLTVTDGSDDFVYTGDTLPLTDGYNLIHYVVEYEDGETVEKTFMADVRATAMNLDLDVYYHAADTYIFKDQMAAAMALLLDENGEPVYAAITDDDMDDYAASLGAVKMSGAPKYDEEGNPLPDQTDEYYVIIGAKCTDETDYYHRNEAVVNAVLNDYDVNRAVSFTSFQHLKEKETGDHEKESFYITPKLTPMGDERFRMSSDHELFFAEDAYGNVSFASLVMPAIDGVDPELSISSNYWYYEFSDTVRSWEEWDEESQESVYPYGSYAFLLDMHDDNPLDLSSLTVTFDPAYSQVLNPSLDGVTEQVTMQVPLNFEKDELGFFLPWEISESEAGQTGGITMTCLRMETNPEYKDTPSFHDITGVEIQGALKSCTLEGDVTMTFRLTDTYGNESTADMVFQNGGDGYFKVNSKDYALREGVSDNTGWYEGYISWNADGDDIYPYIYPFMAELPDNVPEFEYDFASTDIFDPELGMHLPDYSRPLNISADWFSSDDVKNVLPELDFYGAGRYFTNEGYVKIGIVSEGRESDDYADALTVALSVESYRTDNGVFDDGYVRTRTFEKLTGRYTEASRPWTEQAIILPSVTENGEVTVNWTDVFGEKHANTVTITAFDTDASDVMGVHTGFTPSTRTNQDVLVTIKGDRIKNTNEAGETVSTRTCEIAGVTVTLRDGTSFDETDERVSIYAAQPWNATVLMPDNGTINVKYRYPDYAHGTDEAANAVVQEKLAIESIREQLETGSMTLDDVYYYSYELRSKLICVSNIDKTPPTPAVSYVFADTGEEVPGDVTATTRPIRADVTADEPVEGVGGGLSRTFSYGTAAGSTDTVTVRDRAGNTATVTVTCPATITEPQAAENNPPTATVYLAAHLGEETKSIGTFTLDVDGDTTLTSVDEEGHETTETINLNNQTVEAINAALRNNPATYYTFHFDVNDEAPASCAVVSSDASVANVGAQNTVYVRVNGTFNLSVSDNANNLSSLNGIVVSSLDTEAPSITPIYSVYSQDGSPRVRVAFKVDNDETIIPIITGDQSSPDVLSTMYKIYDEQGNVVGRQTGFFVDFESNEDYTFYYKDVYGNASSVTVQIRGIDTEAPSFLTISWSGTINNMTPDSVGAGPTSRNVSATIKTDKDISAVELYGYDEDAENNLGEPLSEDDDATKIRTTLTPGMIELTWTDNVDRKLMMKATSATNNLAAYYELPPVNIIDKTVPEVTMVSSTLAADKSSKEFRFEVSGTEGEQFTSNLAAAYTATFDEDETEIVTRYAVGEKGTKFIYTAKSRAPVTLRFIDEAGNTAEYTITEDMLSDIDVVPFSIKYNTEASDLGAKNSLSDLTVTNSLYVKVNKDSRLTLTADSVVGSPVGLIAGEWNEVTLSNSANIQTLEFMDTNTGKTVYAWLSANADKVAPVISYTGESTVFADETMTLAEIRTLLLADVSAYDAGEPLDPASLDVEGYSTEPGLHTVTYTARDSAVNTTTLERYLYVKGRYDPIIRVNGKDTVPLGTLFLDAGTNEVNITATCALTGDNSVYLAIRPGIMTAARMKYSTVTGTDSIRYTAPKDGFYTILARNRDRTEVLTYIYIESAVNAD